MKFKKCDHYDGKCPCLKCPEEPICIGCHDPEINKAGFAVETENMCEKARKYCESGREAGEESHE